jgi:hypothetical protein
VKRSFIRTAAILVAIPPVIVLSAEAALAAGSSASCTGSTCQVSGNGFPGGTVSVDADTGGSGTALWAVDGPRGYRCSTRFSAAGGVRSWTCSGVPAGNLTATVVGPAGPSVIGIRW